MFTTTDFILRRNALCKNMAGGIIFLPGNYESPINYAGNTFPFRQDSSFLYFIGISIPCLVAIIDITNGETILFGDEMSKDELIWTGPSKSIHERAAEAGISDVKPKCQLSQYFYEAKCKKRNVHFTMPYQSETRQLLASLLSVPINKIGDEISLELTKAIVELRSIKEEKEITAIENMVTETNLLHRIAMQSAKPGIYEREILASMNQYLTAYSYTNPFQPICSVRGEVLHNPFYNNVMQKGDLLLVDAGIEGTSGYSSDITRVTPVGGSFSQQQKEIYEIVLSANLKAIDKIEPGIAYSDIHSFAALTITQGLISLGLMKGNASDAQAQGAHALFFPHGLGHMLGLDTHDMEALGEDYVGYNSSFKRSTQFGTSSLRLARKLEQNFVITVEPGIYFIPELIAQWKRDKKNMAFINYDKVEKFIGFGGIRIEDNVVVTEKGCKVLSAQIPKNVAEVEAIIGK